MGGFCPNAMNAGMSMQQLAQKVCVSKEAIFALQVIFPAHFESWNLQFCD